MGQLFWVPQPDHHPGFDFYGIKVTMIFDLGGNKNQSHFIL